MNGIPYWGQMSTTQALGYGAVVHADQVRYVLMDVGEPLKGVTDMPRFDETVLHGDPAPHGDWLSLVTSALASAAFPMALEPRGFKIPVANYSQRLWVDPEGTRNWHAVAPWTSAGANVSARPADPWSIVTVDGGVMDNEPLGLARVVLSGGAASNPRAAKDATRATILIDPFPDHPQSTDLRLEDMRVPWALSFLFTALKNQARTNPQDLALALDGMNASRKIIGPSRGRGRAQSNGLSLACGLLGGFGGFLDRRLRAHDYELGRRNCQKFLMTEFVLPETNPLFAGWRNDVWAEDYVVIDPGYGRSFPIIPVMEPLREPQPLPCWPVGAVRVEDVTVATAERLVRVAREVAKRDAPCWGRALIWLGTWLGKSKIKGVIRKTLNQALRDYGLR